MPETTTTTHNEEDFIHRMGDALAASCPTKPASGMSDADRSEYLAMLNGKHPAPLDPDKANRILDALWHVMSAFVDLGFGIGPVVSPSVAASDGCGQVGAKSAPKCDKAGAHALGSPHHTKTVLNERAAVADGTANSKNGVEGRQP